jgi:hypothetical protein
MSKHKETCLCCHCTQHWQCIPVNNPRWICLMPNRINEIVIGPLDPLQSDCLLEVKDSLTKSFRIVNKYVYPNFLTRMVKLAVITPIAHIIKPGHLLASLCPVTTENVLHNINGKRKNCNILNFSISLSVLYFRYLPVRL